MDTNKAFQTNMAQFRRKGVRKVEVWSFVNDEYVCDACKQISGTVYDIDEVPTLPYDKCASPMGCRCGIRPVFDMDQFEDELWKILQDHE